MRWFYHERKGFGNHVHIWKLVCNPFCRRHFGDWVPKISDFDPLKSIIAHNSEQYFYCLTGYAMCAYPYSYMKPVWPLSQCRILERERIFDSKWEREDKNTQKSLPQSFDTIHTVFSCWHPRSKNHDFIRSQFFLLMAMSFFYFCIPFFAHEQKVLCRQFLYKNE